MAITQAIPLSFKVDILNGVHQPGDTYKAALYTSAATLDASTAAYSATDEVSGTGYTAGGMALTGRAVTLDGSVAVMDFNDPVWTAATITARGMLIYNASRSNKAVAVYDFGSDITSTAGDFSVQLPSPTAAAALIRAN